MKYIYFFFCLSLGGLFHLSADDGWTLYDAGDYKAAAASFVSQSSFGKTKVQDIYNAARSLHEDYKVNQDLDSLEKAISGYYRVLDYRPDHKESLLNLELARLEYEKSDHEKQDNTDESQQEDQENQENSLSELAEQQKQLSESKDGNTDKESQEQLKKQSEEALNQEKNTQSQKALEEAIQKQSEALNRMENNDPQGASRAQKEAAEALERAASFSDSQEESLSEDMQNILKAEQKRNENKQNDESWIEVEKNW